MKITEPIIDKSTWGNGPWQQEPDRWEGEHEGFPILALRNVHGGNWCGYVAVPPGHPWHGKEYNGVRVDGDEWPDVHGGLTFSGSCHGRICHVPKPGEPDDVWWHGFDCHHAGDVAPGSDARMRQHGLGSMVGDHYRTLGYVQGECQRLAEQAKAAK